MGIFRSYIYPRLIKTNRKKRKEKEKGRNDFIFNIAHESQGKNGTKLIDSNRFSGLCCESSITIENEALSRNPGYRIAGFFFKEVETFICIGLNRSDREASGESCFRVSCIESVASENFTILLRSISFVSIPPPLPIKSSPHKAASMERSKIFYKI